MASCRNLLAVGGTEEVIKLYDLKTKKSAGELAGVHDSAVTCLAISRNCKYVFSGAEDGLVVIWRATDQEPLHQLRVKNVSKVVSVSMHNSGRMLLALYANGMVRLWSMLDARCIFKKKAGIVEDSQSEDEEAEEEAEEEKAEQEQDYMAEYLKKNRRAELIKWEPSSGLVYAVLFDRLLEIYTVESDGPLHQVNFDSVQTGFDFLSPTELVVCDDLGRLTYLKDVDKEGGISMRIVETTYKRFRMVTTSPDCEFFTALTNESISLWNVWSFRDELARKEEGDLMCELQP